RKRTNPTVLLHPWTERTGTPIEGRGLHSAATMGDATSTDPDESRPRWPWLAAVLSFLFPGAGQAYAGNLRAASIFALPAIVLVVLVALVLLGILDLP